MKGGTSTLTPYPVARPPQETGFAEFSARDSASEPVRCPNYPVGTHERGVKGHPAPGIVVACWRHARRRRGLANGPQPRRCPYWSRALAQRLPGAEIRNYRSDRAQRHRDGLTWQAPADQGRRRHIDFVLPAKALPRNWSESPAIPMSRARPRFGKRFRGRR